LYLLDTNIVSMPDPRRHRHAPALIERLGRNGASLFLSMMTITELDVGALELRREGKVERCRDCAGAKLAEPDEPVSMELTRRRANSVPRTRQPSTRSRNCRSC
jgi:predicted nucleic acid-binding protein